MEIEKERESIVYCYLRQIDELEFRLLPLAAKNEVFFEKYCPWARVSGFLSFRFPQNYTSMCVYKLCNVTKAS